ncbi:DNA repair protein rad51c [Linnemannia zychae]|nr:DNA repair protein rad51c [Linnemannia zychae]
MASSRPAITLRLSNQLREKILRSGYMTVGDLCAIPSGDLAKELKLTPEQTEELFDLLYPKDPELKPYTAGQAWEQEKKLAHITTSSQAIDSLFGAAAGIPPGKLTEFCGLPGSGKTQLGIQLSINAQMPKTLGGAGGTSIYIDTEGSFAARRASQMAHACVDKLNQTSNATGSRASLSADDLLRGIQYCRVHSPVEFIAMIRILGSILQEHPNIKLVVVVMNQMTTTVEMYTAGKRTTDSLDDNVHPALGDTWGSICTYRIRLYDRLGSRHRYARLFKSPNMQEQTVYFQITLDGISDYIDNEDVEEKEDNDSPPMDDDDLDFCHSTQAMVFWDDFS